MSYAHLSRRTLLRGSAAATATLTAGLPAPATPQAAGPANVRVSHDQFTMHGEPALAGNPRDRTNLLAACIVMQDSTSTSTLASYASFDAGRSWYTAGALPGAAEGFDPSVAFDSGGNGYIGGAFGDAIGTQASGVRVWRTRDGGRSTAPPVTAIPGYADHPSIAADRWTPRPGVVHVAAARNPGLVYTRSVDHAASFPTPRILDPGGGYPVLAAGPGGILAIVYLIPISATTARVMVTASTDGGRSFPPAVHLTTMSVQPYFNLPAIAVTPHTHRLVLAMAGYDQPTGRSRLDLYTSPDSGVSWPAPVCLASSVHDTYLQPAVAVDEHERVGVSVFAARGSLVDVLLYVHPPDQSRPVAPVRVTGRPFDSRLGLYGRWIGDYQGLTATPDGFHPLWNDTRTGQLEIFTATVRPR